MRMTIKQAIHVLHLPCDHLRNYDEYGIGIDDELQEAMQMAKVALREKAERENHKPLTLEELRQMKEATPVWWQHSEGTGFWCLAQIGVVMVPSGICYDISECQGQLYRYKPKEVGV